MDTLLYHGDYKRDGRGFPVKISGMEEAVQRACIRLTVPMGNFVLDPNLGSRLHMLGRIQSINQEELALEYAREALLGMEDIRVISAKVDAQQQETLKIEFVLEYTGNEKAEQIGVMWELGH